MTLAKTILIENEKVDVVARGSRQNRKKPTGDMNINNTRGEHRLMS